MGTDNRAREEAQQRLTSHPLESNALDRANVEQQTKRGREKIVNDGVQSRLNEKKGAEPFNVNPIFDFRQIAAAKDGNLKPIIENITTVFGKAKEGIETLRDMLADAVGASGLEKIIPYIFSDAKNSIFKLFFLSVAGSGKALFKDLSSALEKENPPMRWRAQNQTEDSKKLPELAEKLTQINAIRAKPASINKTKMSATEFVMNVTSTMKSLASKLTMDTDGSTMYSIATLVAAAETIVRAEQKIVEDAEKRQLAQAPASAVQNVVGAPNTVPGQSPITGTNTVVQAPAANPQVAAVLPTTGINALPPQSTVVPAQTQVAAINPLPGLGIAPTTNPNQPKIPPVNKPAGT
ncbi:hypothetical protein HY213_00595 [Candidatus Peregrinibacteria bacterium]|nr:hypothetical protein [Candidatus Peregrinibacteria bacterium]